MQMMKTRNLRPADRRAADRYEQRELHRPDSEGAEVVVVYSCNCFREQTRMRKNAIARQFCGQSRVLVEAGQLWKTP